MPRRSVIVCAAVFASVFATGALIGWLDGTLRAPRTPPRPPDLNAAALADPKVTRAVAETRAPVGHQFRVGERVRVVAPGAPQEGEFGVIVTLDTYRPGCHLVEVRGVGHHFPDYHLHPLPD